MMTNHDIFTLYQKHSTNLRNQVQDLIEEATLLADSCDIQKIHFGKCLGYILNLSDECEKLFGIWKKTNDELHTSNKLFCSTIQKLELSLRAKNDCLQKFKEDSSSKLIQIEYLKKDNKDLMGTLTMYEKDINQLKISEKWFKDQLNLCQTEKYNFKCQLIKEEIASMKTFVEKEVQKSVEKGRISQKETKRNSYNKSTQTDKCNEQEIFSYCSESLEERDNYSLMHEQEQKTFNVIAKLEEKYIFFEKTLQQTNSIIDTFENIKNQLCDKLKISIEYGNNKNLEILRLIQLVNNLKTEIHQQKWERENVENMVLKMKETFIKIKGVHETLTKKIENQDEIIRNLQIENTKLIIGDQKLKQEEFEKKKIQDLLKSVGTLQLCKQEMAAVHYEEMCKYTCNLKITRGDLHLKHNEHPHLEKKIEEKNIMAQDFTETKEKIEEGMQSLQEKFFQRSNIEKIFFLKIFEALDFNDPNYSKNPEIAFSPEGIDKVVFMIEKIKTSNKKFKKFIFNRFVKIEEKIGRISKLCSRNEAICTDLKKTDLSQLLDRMKHSETLVQCRRFEKYKRPLMASINEYKKLYLTSEEHTEYIQTLCNCLGSEQQLAMSETERKFESTKIDDDVSRSDGEIEDTARNFLDRNFSDSCCQDMIDHLKFEKQELSQRNNELVIDLKSLETNNGELTLEMKNKLSKITELENEIFEKKQYILQLRNNLLKCEKLLEENLTMSSSLQRNIDDMTARLQHDKLRINRLNTELHNLRNDLKRRNELLGKLILTLKLKFDNVRSEMNDKFFLQRLCSDLKSALRIHTDQNKALRHVLQNRSSETIDGILIPRRNNKYNEIDIQNLMMKAADFSNLQESCRHVNSHINYIKAAVIFLKASVSGDNYKKTHGL